MQNLIQDYSKSTMTYDEWCDLPLIYRLKEDIPKPKPTRDMFGNEFKKFFLLHKTHYETGVHYLCITKREDPFKYKGSGVVWRNLLKKYPGSEILTDVLFTTDSKEELAIVARYFSEEVFQGVASSWFFANQVPELGYEGNQGNLDMWVKEQEKSNPNFRNELYFKSDDKRRQTCLERYGVEHTMFLAQEGFRKKYGVKNTMHVPEIKARTRKSYLKTLKDRYGVDHNMKVPEFARRSYESRVETMKEKYGVEHSLQIPGMGQKVKEAREKTLLEKYGVTNMSHLPEVVEARSIKIRETKAKKKKEKCNFCDYESKNIKQHEKCCQHNPNRVGIPTKVCENCGLELSNGNYSRWHGDKCKEIKR